MYPSEQPPHIPAYQPSPHPYPSYPYTMDYEGEEAQTNLFFGPFFPFFGYPFFGPWRSPWRRCWWC